MTGAIRIPGSAQDAWDVAVIGAGLYGAELAVSFASRGRSVVLFEQEPESLARASMNNQCRVHAGYHYPRSFATAARSAANYQHFIRRYPEAVGSTISHYAIAKSGSKVGEEHFRRLFDAVGAPVADASPSVRRLFDQSRVAAVYQVEEQFLDPLVLKKKIENRLSSSGVRQRYGTQVVKIEGVGDCHRIHFAPLEEEAVYARVVINATYTGLGQISGMQNAGVSIRHEIAELCVVDVPDELQELSITLMDGAFFSLTDHPMSGRHLLTDVRFTPHFAFRDAEGVDPYEVLERYPKKSHFELMRRSASQFVPLLKNVACRSSVWEVKTILDWSNSDDSRPIFVSRDPSLPAAYSVLGAKLDNVLDVIHHFEESEI